MVHVPGASVWSRTSVPGVTLEGTVVPHPPEVSTGVSARKVRTAAWNPQAYEGIEGSLGVVFLSEFDLLPLPLSPATFGLTISAKHREKVKKIVKQKHRKSVADRLAEPVGESPTRFRELDRVHRKDWFKSFGRSAMGKALWLIAYNIRRARFNSPKVTVRKGFRGQD
uniref:Uncharacterized protein n=1 Tax=Solanum tuberosum TaxID=4113 RepID=M1D9I5_SOLTU